jgi:N-terminal glutamine amidase
MQSNVGNPPRTDNDDGDSIAVALEKGAPTAATTALSSHNDHDLRVPFYCEENVWRIAFRKLHGFHPMEGRLNSSTMRDTKYIVLFISNERKSVPMFHQRTSLSPGEKPCVWDYHVILLEVDRTKNNLLVYDVDTTLVPYPIPLSDYLSATFSAVEQYCPEFVPLFRLVSAEMYLQYFSSDRSHMYNTEKNTWNEPPPHYRCILPPPVETGRSQNQEVWDAPPIPSIHSNLQYYLDFSGRSEPLPRGIPIDAFGSILTLSELRLYPFFES